MGCWKVRGCWLETKLCTTSGCYKYWSIDIWYILTHAGCCPSTCVTWHDVVCFLSQCDSQCCGKTQGCFVQSIWSHQRNTHILAWRCEYPIWSASSEALFARFFLQPLWLRSSTLYKDYNKALSQPSLLLWTYSQATNHHCHHDHQNHTISQIHHNQHERHDHLHQNVTKPTWISSTISSTSCFSGEEKTTMSACNQRSLSCSQRTGHTQPPIAQHGSGNPPSVAGWPHSPENPHGLSWVGTPRLLKQWVCCNGKSINSTYMGVS